MGKRSRNKPEEVKSREEQLEAAEKEYRQIKRMMFVALIAIVLLVVGLLLSRPDGYIVLVILLVVIEGVSYPLLRKSLDRRRAERIAAINSGE